MKLIHVSALFVAVILTGCQTTSLREYSADESNDAKKLTELNVAADYPEPAETHHRMFIFTSFEKNSDGKEERDGYYIDFSTESNKH